MPKFMAAMLAVSILAGLCFSFVALGTVGSAVIGLFVSFPHATRWDLAASFLGFATAAVFCWGFVVALIKKSRFVRPYLYILCIYLSVFAVAKMITGEPMIWFPALFVAGIPLLYARTEEAREYFGRLEGESSPPSVPS